MRDRVRSKLVDSRVQSQHREIKAEDEIVIQVEKAVVPSIEFEPTILSDGERRRKIAATLVLIGSLMGVMSGALFLQGNPSSLLNSSLFKTSEVVDTFGFVLDNEGEPMVNVTIELMDQTTNSVIQTTFSDENGRFRFEDVAAKNSIIKFSKPDYTTIEYHFTPDPSLSPITMHLGDGVQIIDESEETTGWSMEDAVALATVEGLFTIGCALVGVQASFEIRRAKKYRRTQALCWIALFSRGLIIPGPALILTGMCLIIFNRQDFEDWKSKED
ncbi:MAG: hypothetical protein CXT71_02025 [Methanobacteriota archaeon]|nr:MAG: hypothetical protein CXT71_02025 [Euryarchaeota archaeon]